MPRLAQLAPQERGVQSLCEKQKEGYFENEKLVQNTFVKNKNARYRNCNRHIFGIFGRTSFFTQALKPALRRRPRYPPFVVSSK